ncbi:hypothetical protein HDV00_005469 [Rhizophlyctis rosea]|nr:hypothetical protein HDV00_005469 [Rhizophlyctis rosea]
MTRTRRNSTQSSSDRHTARNGMKPVLKRNGSGKGNWGRDDDIFELDIDLARRTVDKATNGEKDVKVQVAASP